MSKRPRTAGDGASDLPDHHISPLEDPAGSSGTPPAADHTQDMPEAPAAAAAAGGADASAAPGIVMSHVQELFMNDFTHFLQSTITPMAISIEEEVAAMQYEADAASQAASGEHHNINLELHRLSTLVTGFQAHIQELLQGLAG